MNKAIRCYTCKFCKEEFDDVKVFVKHLQDYHGASRRKIEYPIPTKVDNKMDG